MPGRATPRRARARSRLPVPFILAVARSFCCSGVRLRRLASARPFRAAAVANAAGPWQNRF
eukprot:3841105-Lingulodinium_polyedra.AAC.1